MAALPMLPAIYASQVAEPAPSTSEVANIPEVPFILGADGQPTNRRDYTITPEDFSTKVTALTRGMRDVFKLAEAVYGRPAGEKVTIADPVTKQPISFGRRDIIHKIGLLAAGLSELPKHFNALSRAKRAPRRGGSSKTKSLFYVSDQLVNYLANANYGNGLAAAFPDRPDLIDINGAAPNALEQLAAAGISADEIVRRLQAAENADAKAANRQPEVITAASLRNINVVNALDLIINRRMATSAILIILLALITSVGKLKSNVNGQRNHYDGNMLKYFEMDPATQTPANTRWILNGADITPAEVPPTVSSSNRAAFAKKLSEVNLSSFERLRRHEAKNPGEAPCQPGESRIRRQDVGTMCVPCLIPYQEGVHSALNDNWGILHSMYMVIISHFRIPPELLSPEAAAALKSVPTTAPDGTVVEGNKNIIDSAHLQNYLQGLLKAHRIQTAVENKAKRPRKPSTAKPKRAAAAKRGAAVAVPSVVPALPPLPL